METFVDAFVKALCGTSETLQVEVDLPYGMTSLDMYKIFKDAAEGAGCTLTNFEVIKKDSA